ncbi:fluoride efflux transporter FluC [Pediococcus claussenii]|uniref:Fluoride-specific ion channel FluC n=1 Tax=Pediococcus claussenii (strain ATCC BAA-344 / DSM 14800 / JCM 18046 / KCTC 3811 / LMG 21948 / P06) TaxID=701521 RepID=G8PD75_PEDCP|nr:CrcB family protein [Pediococcus claussenii]AEV95210.1 crcB-like family protein [Pediococcus claussenii ATCC BAA-344]ANZ70440.1 hypothetical protein AYR57_08970 [Pediococcus claussenii]ANZ72256.1 hypothetical protein AYR58_08970 [Pediococcus claussenii]KRN19607.1 hypothetical protein IV79_GL001324 [Pediococcus claussenii]
MRLKQSISVAIFAFIGGDLRWILQSIITPKALFPWSTLLINLSGTFILGILTGGLLVRISSSPILNIGLTSGLLGGFTTFSSFEFTNLKLLATPSHIFIGISYMLISVFFGILLANLGQHLGEFVLKDESGW